MAEFLSSKETYFLRVWLEVEVIDGELSAILKTAFELGLLVVIVLEQVLLEPGFSNTSCLGFLSIKKFVNMV